MMWLGIEEKGWQVDLYWSMEDNYGNIDYLWSLRGFVNGQLFVVSELDEDGSGAKQGKGLAHFA